MMKHFIIYTLLFFSLPCLSQTDLSVKHEIRFDGIKGKVDSVISTHYGLSITADRNVPTREIRTYFNKKGYITREVHKITTYDRASYCIERVLTRNKKQRLIKQVEIYDHNSSEKKSTTMILDSCINNTFYWSAKGEDQQFEQLFIIKYEPFAISMFTKSKEDPNFELTVRRTCRHDMQIDSIYSQYIKEKNVSVIHCEYNDKGIEIRRHLNTAKDFLHPTSISKELEYTIDEVYTFDKRGNWIEQHSSISGEERELIKREIFYRK